jgi:hypothetical protein
MKTLSPSYLCIVTLLCLIVLTFSCTHQDKSTVVVTPKALKNLNKDTLLNVVTQLAVIMQKEPHSTLGGKKLLKAYALTYKINIGGALNHKADSNEYLNVFIPEDGQQKPEMVAFRLYPPQSLRSRITFNDLKRSFGDFTISPPMEQDTTSTSIFNIKAAPDAFLGIISKKRPGENNNSVEVITVMR